MKWPCCDVLVLCATGGLLVIPSLVNFVLFGQSDVGTGLVRIGDSEAI